MSGSDADLTAVGRIDVVGERRDAGSAVDRLGVYADRLYVATSKTSGAGLVTPVDPLTFGATGTLDSGLVSCGLPGVSKLFKAITIVTSATNDEQGRALLKQLGFPFRSNASAS